MVGKQFKTFQLLYLIKFGGLYPCHVDGSHFVQQTSLEAEEGCIAVQQTSRQILSSLYDRALPSLTSFLSFLYPLNISQSAIKASNHGMSNAFARKKKKSYPLLLISSHLRLRRHMKHLNFRIIIILKC